MGSPLVNRLASVTTAPEDARYTQTSNLSQIQYSKSNIPNPVPQKGCAWPFREIDSQDRNQIGAAKEAADQFRQAD
ncbi:MAG: hypothetical protein CMM01_20240 [Rhodopirellula sp.]|nr:hypothetical protein [Rhodopirellula sp.]